MIQAAVFFRDHLEMTADLVNSLDGADMIHLFDNGSEDDIVPLLGDNLDSRKIQLWWTPGMTLSEMWNKAWQAASAGQVSVDLAILNNDIQVEPGFLASLSTALHSDDNLWAVSPESRFYLNFDKPTGEIIPVDKVGIGGMAGWAFMVRTEKWTNHLVDPQFEWWYGDNDVAAHVLSNGGKIGMVEGLTCNHLTSATWIDHPELHSRTDVDRELYVAKWGYLGLH